MITKNIGGGKMPAGTLGAAFPRNGIEDILDPLDNKYAKEQRRIACNATNYLLVQTVQNICYNELAKQYQK